LSQESFPFVQDFIDESFSVQIFEQKILTCCPVSGIELENFLIMLQVKYIKDYQKFLALQDSWNALVEKSSMNSIFVRHEWIRCWWDAYGQDNRLLILLFQEEGVLKAIAPLMISTGLFREKFSVRKISFIENDETPNCGLIADASFDLEKILDSLLICLKASKEEWDILLLRKIHENSQLIKMLPQAAAERRENIFVNTSLRSPVLYMNSAWDQFYAGKSQRFKKKIRYDRNKLNRSGKIDVQFFDTPEQIAAIIEEIFSVGRRSWKEDIGNSIGSTPQNRFFFANLPSALSCSENRVVLWVLRLDNKIISFEYHLRQGKTVYALRGEYDEDYQDRSPGAVLDAEVVQQLFEQGVQAYDMCGDAANQYKLRWTSDVQPYRDILLFNNNIRGKSLAFLENRIVPFAKLCRKLVKDKRS
jgi:CelD/BcsL family acetyltransferase involved in cellulose biosynthesis